jgi:hypothetical protein
LYIPFDFLIHPWPKESSANGLICSANTKVASNGCIVGFPENSKLEIFLLWDEQATRVVMNDETII